MRKRPGIISVEENLIEEAEKQLRMMRVPEALKLFHQAETAQYADACAAGRWTCHMLNGDFEEAWQESDSIAQRGRADQHRFWDGRPVCGKRIILRCLHGLGDTLQFIRYAPLLRSEARFLTIEAQPKLKPILACSELADRVITWGEEEPAWEQQIEIIELPRIFRTQLTSIPNQVPYLRAPTGVGLERQRWRAQPRVGIVWSASEYNPARSIPLSLISQWFEVPGISFLNLQFGPERLELDAQKTGIPSLRDEEQPILEIAGVIQTLDLVITVDTMMAHLAGALGREVWTLLPYQCDWRWMLERKDTPWYRTMRLIRQPEPGDWQSVAVRVTDGLRKLQSATPGRVK
jgi:hypothetical protein